MADTLAIINDQKWLEPYEKAVQDSVTQVLEAGGETGKKVQNALNGTWMGHSLHPAITDIPTGAWTTVLLLDCMEIAASRGARRGIGQAADAAVALGLVGALGAAATGLTDWKDTDGKDRRIGFVHGVLSVAVTALFAGSLVARKTRNRGTGRALAIAGWGLLSASAWLGGELVSRLRVGVNRSAEVLPKEDWFPLMKEADLPENELREADHEGTKVLLLKRGNQIFAIGGACSHRGAPLAEGKLDGDCVVCPWHKSKFSLTDGSVVDGPATAPQPTYLLRVVDGQIEVKAAD